MSFQSLVFVGGGFIRVTESAALDDYMLTQTMNRLRFYNLSRI